MFSHNSKVSVRQVEILLILQMFNTSILLLPRIAANHVGRNGYILPIVALIFGMLYLYAITSLTNRFKGDTIVEFMPKILPKAIGYCVIGLFALKILITTGLEMRMFGEMVSQVMLPTTPLPVIILSLLLTTAYLVKSGIEATARMAEVLMYFIFFPLAIVLVFIIAKADYKQLMPFFETDMVSIGRGAFFISLSFMPIEFMLILAGLMKKQEKSRRAMLLALIIIAIIEAIVIVSTYIGIGVNETNKQIWPVLTLMQSVQFPGSWIENQEVFMMTSWVFSIYMYISSGLYFTSLMGSRSFKFKRENIFLLPIIPVVYFIAIFPKSLVDAYKYYIMFQYRFGIWFLFPIPIILLGIAKMRKAGNTNE
ncbi:GerAB/ArcD/ProY family transporter [Cellulosilyticum sp. I15G10I2]|uniref:GerAB/ArcD/ProY family transporter n=1 Tax=Cellulosilyticum sp. I15G10I2 TaxID=1892843 RepID=UPI00085C2A40|nr:endospore germination permease [Cellulosilyticum sp. I15G10I2]